MMKKVLILCTGNSCRSIIAEALINKYLNNMRAYSAGVSATGSVNPNTKKVLEDEDAWSDDCYSKSLDKMLDIEFDLVVTVCDSAKESCPTFSKSTKVVHVGFEDPDGKDYEAFEETLQEIKKKLLPIVRKKLS
ncbi:arsenate reductase ArsC [Sulfurovum sp. bin170]|nr:arsenate reductase ArsC [Sulfurovum sp. bin170]